jgi:glycosyltransferase involved in cell wall biosynthesis
VTDGGAAGMIAGDEALGVAIAELLLDPDLRARYSAAGIERAREFSWDRACAEHEHAFEAAIAAFAGERPRDDPPPRARFSP